MTVSVHNILQWLEDTAPSGLAEPWDNAGLIMGSADTVVTGAVIALDITPGVIALAAQRGAQVIISHHPPIFKPVSRLDSGSIPYLIARHGLCAIAAHTNLDRAAGGVNDLLAASLGLSNVRTAPDGLCRIGGLPGAMDGRALAGLVMSSLGVSALRMSGSREGLRTVAVCGGAGGEYLAGITGLADAFITGEMKYHEWPVSPADPAGIPVTVIEAGHYHTEIAVARSLADRLSAAFPGLDIIAAPGQCPYEEITRYSV